MFDDFIQMLDFFAQDLRILRARVALRKAQVQRMIKHLHHREWIADFVRDFGGEQTQRGKLFVLA